MHNLQFPIIRYLILSFLVCFLLLLSCFFYEQKCFTLQLIYFIPLSFSLMELIFVIFLQEKYLIFVIIWQVIMLMIKSIFILHEAASLESYLLFSVCYLHFIQVKVLNQYQVKLSFVALLHLQLDLQLWQEVKFSISNFGLHIMFLKWFLAF